MRVRFFRSRDTSEMLSDIAGARSSIAERQTSRQRRGTRVAGRGKREAVEIEVRLTGQTLSCTARAYVPKLTRHDTRLHVRRAMRVACRRDDFDVSRRLGRRTEAG